MSVNHHISEQSRLAHRRAVDLTAMAFYSSAGTPQFRVVHHPGQGTYSVSPMPEDCENGMRQIIAQYPKGTNRR